MHPAELNFQCPLLVLRESLHSLDDAEAWNSGEKWLNSVSARKPLGIVLPLELRIPSPEAKWRQNLWGLDLLDWLRWSGSPEIRYVPVLALAWQNLQTILRNNQNLLLITKGTTFAQLPAQESLQQFVSNVWDGTAEPADEKALSSASTGKSGQAADITYHDLANDHYAAYRLWKGYLFALRSIPNPSASIRDATDAAEHENLACLDEIRPKIRQPWFRQIQHSFSTKEIPEYPFIEVGEALIRRHVEDGLPNTRILFVDDEYDKGLGEVLLRIFFNTKWFTIKRGTESVYSEAQKGQSPKARFVCVKDVMTAQHWLIKWGELAYSILESAEDGEGQTENRSTELRFKQWSRSWARSLGWGTEDVDQEFLDAVEREKRNQKIPLPLRLCRALFTNKKHGIPDVDDDSAAPQRMRTVVLLDLRLDRDVSRRIYSTRQFPSVRFRELIKKNCLNIPIIVFTASRQAMNYAEVMSNAGPIDGWLCKEAPDMIEDDQNSRKALEYLVSRIYSASARSAGYRDEMEWKAADIVEYERFWDSPYRDSCLEQVTRSADALYAAVLGETFSAASGESKGYLSFIQSRVTSVHHLGLVQLLVARRVALATLIRTAALANGKLLWNEKEFGRLLTKKYRTDSPQYVRDVINFREALRLDSYRAEKLPSLLLPEEYDWLLEQDFPQEKKNILMGFRSAVLSSAKRPHEDGEKPPTGIGPSHTKMVGVRRAPQPQIAKTRRSIPKKRTRKP